MPGEPDRVRVTFQLDIAFCSECPFHRIINNPDPTEVGRQADHALLCSRLPNDQINLMSKRPSDRGHHRVILDRGRKLDQQPVPAWCPIRYPNNQELTARQIQSIRAKMSLPAFENLIIGIGLSWSRCTRSLELLPFGDEAKARLYGFLDVLLLGLEVFSSKERLRDWLIQVSPKLGAAPLDACKLRLPEVLEVLQAKKCPASLPGTGSKQSDQSVGVKSPPASS